MPLPFQPRQASPARSGSFPSTLCWRGKDQRWAGHPTGPVTGDPFSPAQLGLEGNPPSPGQARAASPKSGDGGDSVPRGPPCAAEVGRSWRSLTTFPASCPTPARVGSPWVCTRPHSEEHMGTPTQARPPRCGKRPSRFCPWPQVGQMLPTLQTPWEPVRVEAAARVRSEPRGCPGPPKPGDCRATGGEGTTDRLTFPTPHRVSGDSGSRFFGAGSPGCFPSAQRGALCMLPTPGP